MPKQALWQRLRAAAVAYHDPSLRDLLEEAAAEVLSLEQGWSNCSRACARETDRADRAEKALCVPSACTSTAGPGPQAGKPGAEPGTSATSAGVDRDRVLRAIRALGLIKCETIDDVRALSDVITSLSDACWDSVVPPNRAGLRGQCDCE